MKGKIVANNLTLTPDKPKRKLRKVRKHTMYASEATEQIIVMDWAKINESREPRLKMLYAVPNGFIAGGPRKYAIVAHMKKMGMKNGVLDLDLPVIGYGGCPGLRIEMKPKHDKWERCEWDCASKEQLWWRDALQAQGRRVEFCHGASQAIAMIQDHLEMEE